MQLTSSKVAKGRGVRWSVQPVALTCRGRIAPINVSSIAPASVSVLPVFLLETDLIAVGDVFDVRHQRRIATRQDDRTPWLEPLTHSVCRDVSRKNRGDQSLLLFWRHPDQVAEDVVRPSTPY